MCLIRNNKILSASYNYHLFKLVTKLDFLLVGEKNTFNHRIRTTVDIAPVQHHQRGRKETKANETKKRSSIVTRFEDTTLLARGCHKENLKGLDASAEHCNVLLISNAYKPWKNLEQLQPSGGVLA